MQDQRFERSLYEARNRWDIDRRRSGHHVGERKISKDEAGRLLRLALQAMEVPS